MDRRTFITAAGTLSASAALADLTASPGDGVDPTERTMASLLVALAAGTLTCEKLTAAYLNRIDRFDRHGPAFRSVLAVNPSALDDARTLDAERRARHVRGALHGLPLLIKDNIETLDPMATTAGSLALARSRRSVDAPVVARLRAAGAIVLGKTNLSEWANFRSTSSSSGWSAAGGQTRNAYDRDRNPSGSSAGSAVAAAASFCAGAIGTETDGSILSPSSVNGLVGFKPTVGVMSGKGVVPISPRQDTAGPLCRTVEDAALLAAVMAQQPLTFTGHGWDLEAFRMHGVRVGALPVPPGAHPDIAALFAGVRAAFEGESALIVDMQAPPAFADMGGAEFMALLYEFKTSLNAYLGTLDPTLVECKTLADLIDFNRRNASSELAMFGQEIFEKAQACGPLSDRAYRQSIVTLRRTADDEGLACLFTRRRVDILLAPGHGPAELIDAVWGDRRSGDLPGIASAAAVAGYPSITVPAGLVRGLPVGITLVARRHQDGLLLQVARAFERATHARVPPPRL